MHAVDTRGWPVDEQVDRKCPGLFNKLLGLARKGLPEGLDERMLPELPIDQGLRINALSGSAVSSPRVRRAERQV